jgi:hypothetical protein
MSNTDQSWPCPQKFMLLSAVLHITIKDSGHNVTKSLIDIWSFYTTKFWIFWPIFRHAWAPTCVENVSRKFWSSYTTKFWIFWLSSHSEGIMAEILTSEHEHTSHHHFQKEFIAYLLPFYWNNHLVVSTGGLQGFHCNLSSTRPGSGVEEISLS